MRTIALLLAATLAPAMARGQEAGLARPQMLLREVVTGMPRGERQEIQVLTASFRPGDRTVFHTHRHPVTVYVLEGAFTLEMDGHAPVTVRAGEALVEPPGTRMTGYNRAEGPLRVLIVYVAEPGTPFLDLAR
ncbi:cupin domain-containing protein [Roseicella aquatilis]|nr:cupin domain-containing protein [Roseicella aquatilis]